MRKKTVIITVSILLAAVLIAAAAYHIPWPTKIDKTLTVTKLDIDKNEVGTFEIHITGKKLTYLFQEERYLLQIDPFDNIEEIKTTEVSTIDGKDVTGRPVYFGQEHGKDYRQLSLNGRDRSDGSLKYVSLTLFYSGDLDRFAFNCYSDDIIYDSDLVKWSYVGSVSGDYTTEEIVEYFGGLIPGN